MKNLIKVERARKNITQADLADTIHVSRQTIHAIETGKFVPSTMLALKMAHYFGCKVEDIFELEESDLADMNG
ncbi:MAG: helix-turn-helix transcriptional regulator [Bacteroidales bacterium]|jgi:putative transcriptional regulator